MIAPYAEVDAFGRIFSTMGWNSAIEAAADMLRERARLARTVIETDCEPEAQLFEIIADDLLKLGKAA